MPYIEVKATENRLADPAVRERLIAELTDAACRVFGEDVRPHIWVVVEAVPGQQWGVGGKPLTLQVVCPAVRQPDHRMRRGCGRLRGPWFVLSKGTPRCDSPGHPMVTRMRRSCPSWEHLESAGPREVGAADSPDDRSYIWRDLGGIHPAVGFCLAFAIRPHAADK